MTDIYEMKYTKEVAATLEKLRLRIAEVAGVTLVGNRLTIRAEEWEVHCAILEVDTPEEQRERIRKHREIGKLMSKHPDLQAELYRVEHGEYPQ